MKTKYYSNAEWPPEVEVATFTREEHPSKEEAQAMCDQLLRLGLGTWTVYPIKTWVTEEKTNEQKQVQPQEP